MRKESTNFAISLNHYFCQYLTSERNCSPRTVSTYRYAFIQFIEYMEIVKGIKPDALELSDFNRNNVNDFLSWIESDKNVSISTRNQRLAAFRGFCSYIKHEWPEYISVVSPINAIVFKKSVTHEISYLKPEGIKLLLAQINKDSKQGKRDYLILTLLFLTAVRVSELIDIRGRDISLSSPKSLIIRGKGNKVRSVPIVKQLAKIMEPYLKMNRCLSPEHIDECIFLSHTKEPFTRQGINYLVKKYADMVRKEHPDLPNPVYPHMFRRTRATGLYRDGVELEMISRILGHSSTETTKKYAIPSVEMMRKAMKMEDDAEPLWEKENVDADFLLCGL